MANTYKVLGQEIPAANTATTLYTCASSGGAVASTLTMCNQGSSTYVRLAVRPAGAALETKHYVLYDTIVPGNQSTFITIGVTLANTDVVTCYASSANVSFNLYGTEVS